MSKFTKNEKPPRLHGEIVKFLADTVEEMGQASPRSIPESRNSSKNKEQRPKVESRPRIKVYEQSDDQEKQANLTFHRKTGNKFFEQTAHRSQKDFSETRGIHDTFSFGSLD